MQSTVQLQFTVLAFVGMRSRRGNVLFAVKSVDSKYYSTYLMSQVIVKGDTIATSVTQLFCHGHSQPIWIHFIQTLCRSLANNNAAAERSCLFCGLYIIMARILLLARGFSFSPAYEPFVCEILFHHIVSSTL